MFSRCASGSCDSGPFSVGVRAWIVEDIALMRNRDGSLCKKLGSLAEGLKQCGSMLKMVKFGCCFKE